MALVAEELLWVIHEVANSASGGSLTASTWVVRVLNTVKLNQIAGASVATNQVTLPAGTYWMEAHQSLYSGNARISTRWYNVTDAAEVFRGLNCFDVDRGENAPIRGEFTIGAEKDFELQVWSNATEATIGLGDAQDEATHVETYCQLRIWKRA